MDSSSRSNHNTFDLSNGHIVTSFNSVADCRSTPNFPTFSTLTIFDGVANVHDELETSDTTITDSVWKSEHDKRTFRLSTYGDCFLMIGLLLLLTFFVLVLFNTIFIEPCSKYSFWSTVWDLNNVQKSYC